MIYISIDCETTGLEPEIHQVLSISAIIEDTEKKLPFAEIPRFNAAILHREISGSPVALNMNRELIKYIAEYQKAKTGEEKEAISKKSGYSFYEKEFVTEGFFQFLYANGIVTDIQPESILNGIPRLTSNIKPAYITVAGKNFGTFDKNS